MSAKTFAGGVAALVLFGAMGLAAAPANAACKGFVSATAEGTFKTPTELIARARWRNEVRDDHGNAYAFWSRAKFKTTSCSKRQPGNKWYCVARARPCD